MHVGGGVGVGVGVGLIVAHAGYPDVEQDVE